MRRPYQVCQIERRFVDERCERDLAREQRTAFFFYIGERRTEPDSAFLEELARCRDAP